MGERVIVSTLNSEGIVTALGEVGCGGADRELRVRARLVDLVKKSEEASSEKQEMSEKKRVASKETAPATRRTISASSPGIELNLRGKLVDDGLDELERYLEKAFSAGLIFVRIVHGKGDGAHARGGP